jgi:hypothetical protein
MPNYWYWQREIELLMVGHRHSELSLKPLLLKSILL